MLSIVRRLLGSPANFESDDHRATHKLVVGQPNTGKSRALESWVMQDVLAGRGVGVIDPHGELFDHLVWRLTATPEVWSRVALIDPCNPKWAVCFNPLVAVRDYSLERMALFLTDIVINIWQVDPMNAPRMVWLLTNTFLALAELHLTLLDLPRFLLDNDFRLNQLPRLRHQGVADYFAFEYPQTPGGVHQWATPVLNKIGNLIFDDDARLMLGGNTTIDFRTIMDEQLILLVHIPKGIIGEGVSSLLGAFIVAHLQKAALSRANTQQRPQFFLYLDEFQNYTSSHIKDILSESRKYRLSLTLAHQYLDQLTPEIRSAVLNTTGTVASFRVGYEDAYRLAKEIFPSPDFLTTVERAYQLKQIGLKPTFQIEQRQKPLGWEGLAHELTRLPNRYFWSRQRGKYLPTLQRTLEMPDPEITRELRALRRELVDVAGEQYGRLKREVRHELERRQRPINFNGNGRGHPGGTHPDDETIPLWGQ